jgi:hypothetical protein
MTTPTYRAGDVVLAAGTDYEIRAIADSVEVPQCPECPCPIESHSSDWDLGVPYATCLCRGTRLDASACVSALDAPEFVEAVELMEVDRSVAENHARYAELDAEPVIDVCSWPSVCGPCPVHFDTDGGR